MTDMLRGKWKRDGNYAFRRGRRPLVIAVTLSTHNQWHGKLEWWWFPNSKEPSQIPLTHGYASHEAAMKATEKALYRFETALSKLVKW